MKTIILLAFFLGSLQFLRAADDLFSILDSTLPVNSAPDQTDYTPEDSKVEKSTISKSDKDLQILSVYRRRIPVAVAEIPDSDDGERLFWKAGDVIRDLQLPRGEYTVLRLDSYDAGFFIRILGRLESNGRNAKVTQIVSEIQPGDAIVRETFDITLPPITSDKGFIEIQTRKLGTVASFIEADQDEELFFSGSKSLIAAHFDKYVGGNSTSIGASFIVKRKGTPIAKAIVVDADLDVATMYVYDSIREVRTGDEIFVQ